MSLKYQIKNHFFMHLDTKREKEKRDKRKEEKKSEKIKEHQKAKLAKVRMISYTAKHFQ